MTGALAIDNRAAQDRVATLALSLFAIHGFPAPGTDALGGIVFAALASVSPEELRRPENISTASLGRIDELVKNSVEARKPHNLYGAEAARAAQAAGTAASWQGGSGLDRYDPQRGSSARFREMASDGVTKASGQGTGAGPLVGGAGVTPEFARSFAGTGMSGGTLKTFAEVGLDRGTFNQFRKEGFTTAQIADNARDSKALGWHGKEDLSIAQHASTDVRKAAVATEQAKTPEDRAKGQAREDELERKNETRPDSDPQKHHNRRFFQRRHQDHVQHDAKAGLGSAAKEQGSEISSPKGETSATSRKERDAIVVNGGKKQTAALSSAADDAFGTEAPATPAKPAPTKSASVKPAAGSTPS